MKNLFLAIITLTIALATTSCSKEDSGLTIELVAPTDTNVSAGETVDILLNFTDDEAISQLTVEGSTLGIDFLENYTTSPSATMKWEGNVTIPTDAQLDDKFDILVSISDVDGNRVERTVVLTVVK